MVSHDFLFIFALRLRHPVSSFFPFRAHFGSEYLVEPFPSEISLLVDELVLVEIQHIRVVRPVIPIFEHKFVAEAHRYNYCEIQLGVLAS